MNTQTWILIVESVTTVILAWIGAGLIRNMWSVYFNRDREDEE